MKYAFRNQQYAIALAFLAAVAVLLAAWLLPLPRLVLSDEEDAAKRMPQTQADVEAARAAFEESLQSYQGYVAKNDVGAALNSLQQAIENYPANVDNQAAREELLRAAEPVRNYLAALAQYQRCGNEYFKQLSHYDDELMAWTRSLGTRSEALRPDTWPIVEYLKLYPPPIGIKDDYTAFDESALQGLMAVVSSPEPAQDTNAYTHLVTDIREAGRSVEYSQGLNEGYATLLQNYFARLQAIASGPESTGISDSRAIVGYIGNTILAAIIVAGLAALFVARKSPVSEATR